MIVLLKNLTAVHEQGEWEEQRGQVSCIQKEVAPGCMVYVSLGAAGVQVFHGKTAVGIPLDAIVALAQKHEPGLNPTTSPTPAVRE